MRISRIIKYLIIIASIVFVSFIIFNRFTENNIPSLDSRSNDSNLSAEYKNAHRSADFFREQIEKNPADPENYVGLAQVLIQEARVTGKHHEYLSRILRLLDTALNLDKENLDANLTKASVLLNLHQFEEAEKIGKWAVKKYPYSSTAYGILVDAFTELGRYKNAVEMCDRMLQIKPDLRSYSRASYLRELHGDLEGATGAMKMAAAAGMTGEENRAWVLYNLGNLYLQMGRTDTASFIYHGILDERPGYAHAFSGLASIEIIRHNYSKAIEYLKRASLNLDDHSFPEQLSGLYLALNYKTEEEKLNRLILNEFAEHKKRGWNIDLEYAVFCLNHNINLKEALHSAEREYQRRPDNINVIDTYAWALYKNGKPHQSSKIIEKALKADHRNALIYYHAGLINLSLNNNRQAVKNLETALALNLAVHVSSYRDALEKLKEAKDLAILR